ncbi:hypothetical protein [Bradyrhizobium sp. USDA 4369]
MTAPTDPESAQGQPLAIATTDRLINLDILRGLALFGVMAINVVFEFRVSIFRQFLPVLAAPQDGTMFVDTASVSPKLLALLFSLFGDSPFNRALEEFLDRAVSMKAFALFSLMFGIGLAMQFDRIAPHRRLSLLLRASDDPAGDRPAAPDAAVERRHPDRICARRNDRAAIPVCAEVGRDS